MKRTMNFRPAIVALGAAAVLITGCADMSQTSRDTAKGAGIGAGWHRVQTTGDSGRSEKLPG